MSERRDARVTRTLRRCAHRWGGISGGPRVPITAIGSRIPAARDGSSISQPVVPGRPHSRNTWYGPVAQPRYPDKASRFQTPCFPRSERLRPRTRRTRCNMCATGALETLTYHGFQAVATLSVGTVADRHVSSERSVGRPRIVAAQPRCGGFGRTWPPLLPRISVTSSGWPWPATTMSTSPGSSGTRSQSNSSSSSCSSAAIPSSAPK